MDKNQSMLINAMCLYTAPELIQMTALFSGLSQALEDSVKGFVTAVGTKLGAESGSEPADLKLSEFFDDGLNELVSDLIQQFHVQSDVLLDEYDEQFREVEANGGFDKAARSIDYFISLVPSLKPLDQLLAEKDILAYISFFTGEGNHSKELIKFIECFSPVFEQMEANRRADIEREQKIAESWFIAASENDVALLKKLRSEGADPDSRNNNKKSALALAVMANHLEAVEYLLSEGAVPVVFSADDSPLVIAVENNRLDIISAILKANHEKIQEIDWSNFLTFIHEELINDKCYEAISRILSFKISEIDMQKLADKAIKNRANKILELCLENGVSPDDEYFSESLSLIAMDENNVQALDILLKQGADINFKNMFDESLLEISVKKDFPEISKLLIDFKIKLNFKCYFSGLRFLVSLSELINISVVECLLLGLFDPSAYDNTGRSFMHAIAINYDEDEEPGEEVREIIDVLIDKMQVDINQTTESGEDTALTLVSHEQVFENLLARNPVMGLMLSNGKSVLFNIVDKFEGRAFVTALKTSTDPIDYVVDASMLHYCFQKMPVHIPLLIEQGVDLNMLDDNNLTVLQKHIADKARMEPCLVEMARKSADFSINTKLATPIFHVLCAVYGGEIIKEVVEHADIDIHVSDSGNNNAMMHAYLAKNTSALIALAELGVDVNQVNIAGGNPFIHSVFEDDVEMLNLLVGQCGAKTDVRFAGKAPGFIADYIASYDVWNALNDLS